MRGHTTWVAGGLAAASLVVTVVWALLGTRTTGEAVAGVWGLGETLVLAVLAGMVARWSAPRRAALVLAVTGVACAAMVFRFFQPASPLEAVGVAAFWTAPAAVAAGLGLYLRSQDTRRVTALAEHRLRVARDLHDFVAHDVSEMIAQAQAAQIAFDPTMLVRIEQAGQRAMDSMDRMVGMLHGPETSTAPAPGIDDIPALAARFSPPVEVDIAVGAVRREASALAYRIVVEALTNVRRHAPEATWVRISVREGLLVSVVNDGVRERPVSGRGGYGLPGLTEQAKLLGGALEASARGGEWHLEARIP
ncbi:sensor histidine kinase [Nonomuraea sp. NPDC050556]|uniref:sensor histidine kinase n=1 Tax=Nonomuraea sp. NPDC050556 TaxID=3364369 RepID=UPI0037991D8F